MTKAKVITLGLLALFLLAMLCAQRSMTSTLTPASAPEPAHAKLSLAVESGRIVLRGGVPDVTLKQQLVAKAYQVFGAGNVVNQLTVESHVRSEEWLPRTAELIARLKGWGGGAVAFEGATATVTGEVKTEADKTKRQEELAALLGSSAKIESQLLVPGTSAPTPPNPASSGVQTGSAGPAGAKPSVGRPSGMLARVQELMAGKSIDFEIGSATLTASSAKLLDELVPILQSEKDSKIEIGGHTDNYGDPKFNQMVSQARAVAVAQYLIGRGVDGHRLVSKGYGDAKPIASNKTKDGRRLNRRVTFQGL